MLHDGLVARVGTDDTSYVASEGHEVDRVQADRVFRDAMADTGTGLVRRWIVWAAVTLASFFVGADPFNRPASLLAAAAVISTIPITIIVLLFQRKIVAGLTSGAVKG